MKQIDEMRKSYNSFIERQRKGYEMTAAMVGYIIERMQEAGMISEDVCICGRIKSFKSAYENTGKKAVDDCFGLRIMGSKEDLEKIEQELRQMLIVDITNYHRKKKNTSYNAIHEMVHIRAKYMGNSGIEPETFPEIEVQYWNDEVREKCVDGELSYAKYKSKDLLDIIERLNTNREQTLNDLPVFYEIKGREIKKLSKVATLYKMYPEIRQMEERRMLAVDASDQDMEDVANR